MKVQSIVDGLSTIVFVLLKKNGMEEMKWGAESVVSLRDKPKVEESRCGRIVETSSRTPDIDLR